MDRPRHCFASVTIGRTDGPSPPLLRVCSNNPRGWTDHVATRVPLHDLASRGPSAPNRTNIRTNTRLSRNIYRASIASRDKKITGILVCGSSKGQIESVAIDCRRSSAICYASLNSNTYTHYQEKGYRHGLEQCFTSCFEKQTPIILLKVPKIWYIDSQKNNKTVADPGSWQSACR